MAAESKLQTRIIKDLRNKGWLVNKIKLCSLNGWPDIMAFKKVDTVTLGSFTKMVFIECKSPGKKLEPLQEHVHSLMNLHGLATYVIDNWQDYKQLNLL